MKIDLHVHTIFSPDNFTPLKKTMKMVKERGIDCVAITDHGEIKGALLVKKIASFKVIVGEEIMTKEKGEIIGLFLKERIPQKLSADETIRRIKNQGGLVYVPHPYTKFFNMGFSKQVFPRLLHQGKVDIVEVFNASAFKVMDFEKAERMADKFGIAKASSSDTHFTYELGKAYSVISDFDDPKDLVKKLKNAEYYVKKAGYLSTAFMGFRNEIISKVFKLKNGKEYKFLSR